MGGFGFLTGYWADFLSLTVEGRMTGSIVPASGEGFTFRGLFFGGAAVPCFHRGVLFVCGAFHLGRLEGSEAGSRDVRTLKQVGFGLGLRPGFERIFANRFAVRGFVDVTGAFRRAIIKTSVFKGQTWEMPPIGLSVGLALAIPLPL